MDIISLWRCSSVRLLKKNIKYYSCEEFSEEVIMKRIIVVAVTILMLIGVLIAGCAQPEAGPSGPGPAPAPAKGETMELKFATFIPPFDVYAEQMQAWADELEAESGGRMTVDFYHAESLVKMPDLFDAVAAGTADIAMIDANLTPERLALSG